MVRIHSFKDLLPGILLKRYKRFLVDVRLGDGSVITAFTPNSGSMMTCSDPGSPVMLSYQDKPGRKTSHTLEMVKSGDTWVGVNTVLANELAAAIVDRGLTGSEALEGFTVERREFTYGDSRIDLLLTNGGRRCLAEVKNVTLRDGDTARFPDAVTSRGKKHLRTLIKATSEGYQACMIYMVQRSDCSRFGPAGEIDPRYVQAFHEALGAEVLMIAISLEVTPSGIFYIDSIPVTESSLP